jgi:hypothetical protein
MSNLSLQSANPFIQIAEDEPEGREMPLRDARKMHWTLERRQLQMENQRLQKQLEAAHKRIRILQLQHSAEDATVISTAVTVQTGSSVQTLEKSTSVWKLRFPFFFHGAEQKSIPIIPTPPALKATTPYTKDPRRKFIFSMLPTGKYELGGVDVDSCHVTDDEGSSAGTSFKHCGLAEF